jgi:four helix bundle protein
MCSRFEKKLLICPTGQLDMRGGEEMLTYQKLDVYQCSIQFIALVVFLITKLPRGYSFLADELKRASVSIPQNIAEGIGKPGAADRSRYLGIARGSAMECGAILDVGTTLKLFTASDYEKGMELVERIVSMLSKMMKLE